MGFIAFKMYLFQQENALLTRTLSMTLRVRAKVITRVVIRFFMTRRHPLNNSDVT